MSTRQLRRLQKQRELHVAVHKNTEQAEEDEEEYNDLHAFHKSKGSLFANLTLLDGSENENDKSESEKHEVEIKSVDRKPYPASISEKNKKLNSKKKKKRDKSINNTHIKPISRAGEDEIERALQQLDIKSQRNDRTQDFGGQEDGNTFDRICALLSVQGKRLKVANEMRRLFNKDAIENNAHLIDVPGPDIIRRQQYQDQTIDLETILKGTHPPGKGIPEIILRRNFFIQGKSHWPKGTVGGLSIEIVNHETSDGTVEFRYVHNLAYQKIQNSFHKVVEIGDPQILVNMLVKNPDHISLLLQVSSIAKSLGNHSLSSDLIERALFFLGKAATSHFTTKLSQGKARMSFTRRENRDLWLAGYRYIKSLMMKGTYRTALEWAKLLLSLDPKGDPYCMRFLIHNLSLRAHENKWLLDLYHTGFHKKWTDDTSTVSHDPYSHTNPSLALAAISMKDKDMAWNILKQSLVKLPWLYHCLFSELNLQIPSYLKECKAHGNADALFTKIYISQTRDLWDVPEVTSFLIEIANTITRIDESKVCSDDDKLITLDVIRYIYFENVPEILGMIPMSLMDVHFNMESDPIPPTESTISYDTQQPSIYSASQFGPSYLVISQRIPSGDSHGGESNNEFTLLSTRVSEEDFSRMPLRRLRSYLDDILRHTISEEDSYDDNHSDNQSHASTHNNEDNHDEEVYGRRSDLNVEETHDCSKDTRTDGSNDNSNRNNGDNYEDCHDIDELSNQNNYDDN